MVVLYYIGSDACLWADRKFMRKYSHICKGRANFTMVSIAQNMMYINTRSVLRFVDPDNIRLEIIRPRQNV